MISCILPTCRGGTWVTDRLYELSISTYKDLDIIIVEDGYVEPYIIPDSLPVRVIKLDKNSNSVSIPRAIGISYAIGDYIAHIDDDVIIYSNKFGIYNVGSQVFSYSQRVENLCKLHKINYRNKIIETHGKIYPVAQNFDVSKVNKEFNFFFS